MDSLCYDIVKMIFDYDIINTYDMTNLRLTCKRFKVFINTYYHDKLSKVYKDDYDDNIDYFKLYLLKVTDMNLTRTLFLKYNMTLPFIIKYMDMVKYLHDLNDSIGKIVSIVLVGTTDNEERKSLRKYLDQVSSKCAFRDIEHTCLFIREIEQYQKIYNRTLSESIIASDRFNPPGLYTIYEEILKYILYIVDTNDIKSDKDYFSIIDKKLRLRLINAKRH